MIKSKSNADVLDNSDKTYEIVLVNDCSPDNSWEKITELCEIYGQVKGITLSLSPLKSIHESARLEMEKENFQSYSQ